MAPTRRKRAAVNTSSKQLAPKRRAKASPQAIDASSYPTPNNPQATLLGLPAELRLQIYAYLNAATLVHAHGHEYNSWRWQRFTWTPCKAPHPTHPLLCANPKWSGLCNEQDRCTYKKDAPPEPRGFYALAATNKLVRGECMEFSMAHAVVSVNMAEVESWMDFVEARAPKLFGKIRRITFAGSDRGAGIYSEVERRMPQIEAMGFQLQTHPDRWIDSWNSTAWELDPKLKHLTRWAPVRCAGHIDNPGIEPISRHVTVVAEGTVWLDRVPNRQAVFRVIREGKALGHEDGDEGRPLNGIAWNTDNFKTEVIPAQWVVNPKRNAGWRWWWIGEESRRDFRY
ncbi:hypothetical protein BDV95DRAFT_612279 [Massariosphaeria phaeospora]|uniref:Uncharacterized protein n=1 Tax=Massariosphaeria phaeospora TaxID=100035 RepID=A0A7C8HZ04_9PLEO|nr:hypothetical protein BDV95DRAFT_612279 [Massariosphaeria phaeospora]